MLLYFFVLYVSCFNWGSVLQHIHPVFEIFFLFLLGVLHLLSLGILSGTKCLLSCNFFYARTSCICDAFAFYLCTFYVKSFLCTLMNFSVWYECAATIQKAYRLIKTRLVWQRDNGKRGKYFVSIFHVGKDCLSWKSASNMRYSQNLDLYGEEEQEWEKWECVASIFQLGKVCLPWKSAFNIGYLQNLDLYVTKINGKAGECVVLIFQVGIVCLPWKWAFN